MGENGILSIIEKLFITLGIIEEGEPIYTEIFKLLSNSFDFQVKFKEIYGWESDQQSDTDNPYGGFNYQLFLNNLKNLFEAIYGTIGRDSAYEPSFISIEQSDSENNLVNVKCNRQAELLNIPLLTYKEGGKDLKLEAKVLPLITSQIPGNDAGLAIIPSGSGTITKTFPIIKDLWNLYFEVNGSLNPYALVIRPNSLSIQDLSSISEETSSGEFDISALLKREKPNQKPLFIIGDKNGTRFEIGTLGVKLQLSFHNNELEFILAFPIEDARIVIQSGDGDGFIQKVLPKNPIVVTIPITPTYSSKKGFYIDGGVGFEYTFNINKSIGPIFINSIDLNLDLDFDGPMITLITAVTGGLDVGPFAGVIEKIGLKTNLEFDSQGISDVSFGFKPPTGIGLSLDVGGVKGGGYLSIDPPNYAGILNLSVKNTFSITAIALLCTKLPDNKSGFSLLLSLMAEFGTPIQLGYGFALRGVGGIVGINRRMNKDALIEAQKAHTLEHVLFPEDPIKNATAIISTISNIFPPEKGYFVFGPMVRLFWGGVKRLVDFDLGIFIEFGGDGLVALIGLAHAALPTDDKPVIELNLDVLGVIDFGDKSLFIRASLFNSSILQKFTICGDMALQSNWGDDPDFLLSIGGFHPRFDPPPGYPELKRLSISMGKDNPRICFSLYLAITTNTFQTGAKLEVYAKAGKFSVEAGLGFDALIRFKPFMFDVGIFAYAAVKLGSVTLLNIDLDLNLKGPNPYHVKGHGIFEILFIKIRVKFDKEFGDKFPEDLETVSSLDRLVEVLGNTSPIYILPEWANEGVNLTEEAEDFLSPIGNVIFTQNAVPIGLEMQKFGGGAPPANEKLLLLGSPNFNGQNGVKEVTPAPKSKFAPAEFKRMSDNEKISAPAFESYRSGIRIGGTGKNPSVMTVKTIEYETILITHESDLQNAEFISVGRVALADLPINDRIKRSWTTLGSRKYHNPHQKIVDKTNPNYIKVEEPMYAVATSQSENGAFSRVRDDDKPCSNMTYFQASDHANRLNNSTLEVMNVAYVENIVEEED